MLIAQEILQNQLLLNNLNLMIKKKFNDLEMISLYQFRKNKYVAIS